MDNQLKALREQIDDFMQFHPQSPLADDQRDGFKGLDYYGENPALVIVATVEHLPDDEPIIEMETSTGDARPFRRWGTFAFEVDAQPARLTLYSDPTGEELFLPFRDATSGNETYGAGRYLDNHRPGLRRLGEDEIEVDFNYAYNPYCAYSSYFSCPLPPRENWLAVPIRAGEKDFRS
ncbi:MAG TPA: DUF1684 domain-containing protein [Promineifilum sp.]|nr:DUF1684 domain-containing protein [Promineifilum sp.]HRO89638.1 DUF1684 domain-containing protein [Promineifilum sp.]HRQ13372.1 DUF1684 domain-containing protein [Promineifilum sp.]